jgi:hypothetical protein
MIPSIPYNYPSRSKYENGLHLKGKIFKLIILVGSFLKKITFFRILGSLPPATRNKNMVTVQG